jgi:hypothetical protein
MSSLDNGTDSLHYNQKVTNFYFQHKMRTRSVIMEMVEHKGILFHKASYTRYDVTSKMFQKTNMSFIH